VRLARIDAHEAERPAGEYPSLNAYFTRRLKPGARHVEARGAMDVVSPVDGKLTEFGSIDGQTMVQAKGLEYTLTGLLDSARDAARYVGGAYMTIYLSPRDYHRIHAPVRGRLAKMAYVPGHLWPVNMLSVRYVERLFAINERLISYIDAADTTLGRVALVKVGATCVGKMTTPHAEIVTNQALRRRREFEWGEGGVELGVGDELATFNLGSTVILLFEPGAIDVAEVASVEHVVRMGQRLASSQGASPL
ncbi:MAG: archaetidylserine decarboxylase, partial [Myxococcota bacterium]